MPYSAINPPISVTGTSASGVPNTTVIDIEQQLSQEVERALQAPYAFAAIGAPRTKSGVEDNWLRWVSGILLSWPFAANGKIASMVVDKYVGILFAELAKIPLDATGRRQAGSIADHPGAIQFDNGVPDLSQFPLVPTPSAPVDQFDASAYGPPSRPEASWVWLQTMAGARWAEKSKSTGGFPWYTAPFYNS